MTAFAASVWDVNDAASGVIAVFTWRFLFLRHGGVSGFYPRVRRLMSRLRPRVMNAMTAETTKPVAMPARILCPACGCVRRCTGSCRSAIIRGFGASLSRVSRPRSMMGPVRSSINMVPNEPMSSPVRSPSAYRSVAAVSCAACRRLSVITVVVLSLCLFRGRDVAALSAGPFVRLNPSGRSDPRAPSALDFLRGR